MFLSAHSFFWKVRKHGRDSIGSHSGATSGGPEAALIGTQYLANDDGSLQDGFRVTGADLVPGRSKERA